MAANYQIKCRSVQIPYLDMTEMLTT